MNSWQRIISVLLGMVLLTVPLVLHSNPVLGDTLSSPLAPSPPPDWIAEGDQAGANLGTAASSAGDVNGDGFDDLLVGAPLYDNDQANEGIALLYYGSASGLSPTPSWVAESNQAYSQFGSAVDCAGDVNGDGFDDMIVAAVDYDNGQSDEGAVFVYYGSASGPSATPDWMGEGNQSQCEYGRSVGTAGDINGDGYSDIIVGARYYDNGQSNEGKVYVYYGSAEGLSTVPNWTVEGNQSGAGLGIGVGTAGDVNGDGYADVVMGAHLYDNGQADEGAAFLYLGAAMGLGETPDWTAEGNQAGAWFGRWVSTAGDVNGDGYSDLVVAAYLYDNGQTDEGQAYVYLGSPTGLSSSPDWGVESDQAHAHLGSRLSTAGDVNGDGYDDVIINAYLYDNGQTNEGMALVYRGSASGLSLTPDWTTESDQANAGLGIAVDTAGDVNGDGFADLVVGAHHYDNGQTDEGQVYLYYSGGGACDPVHNLTFSWAPLSPQVGEDVLFTATAEGTPPIEFQWQFGDGAVGSGETVAHMYTAAGTYNVTVLATNACGQAAANDNITVRQETNLVDVDIKPRSCPNPLNPRDMGVLPVAVLGTATFDVSQINPESVRLIGVEPLYWSYEDVATPVSAPGYCACTTEGPDGFVDLVLHFDVQAVVAALPWPRVDTAKSITNPPGTTFELLLEAVLADGSSVQGQDCIILLREADIAERR